MLGNYVINSTWNAFDTMIYFERQKNLQNIDILQFAYNCLVLSKTEIFSVVKASCALKDRRFSERSVRLTYVSHIAHVLSIFSVKHFSVVAWVYKGDMQFDGHEDRNVALRPRKLRIKA